MSFPSSFEVSLLFKEEPFIAKDLEVGEGRAYGRCSSFFFRHHGDCFCKNSRDEKSGREFEEPLINSILKSNIAKRACHLAKICFDPKFLTSFPKISFADSKYNSL